MTIKKSIETIETRVELLEITVKNQEKMIEMLSSMISNQKLLIEMLIKKMSNENDSIFTDKPIKIEENDKQIDSNTITENIQETNVSIDIFPRTRRVMV